MSRIAAQDRRLLEESVRRNAREMLFSNAVVDEFLASASLSDTRALDTVLGMQMESRARNRLEKRMRKSRFPAMKSLEGFEFGQIAFPEGYGEQDLRSLGFIDACQDFVFHGKTGRGKTHLAIAIGIAAAKAGKTVRFFTVAQLVMHLVEQREKGRLKKELEDLLSTDLLILDELGYVPLDIEGARLLFQVMSAPEGRQSMIITTNIEFSKWGTVFGDDKMASAVVDRLVYTGRLVEFNGNSYRMENALMLGKGTQGR